VLISSRGRSVSLSLRLVNEETRALGVEAHVCEVQLLLIAMADIKVRDPLQSMWTTI